MDVNCDGVSDLLIGAFLVPGLYIIAGDDGNSGGNSAVFLAIASGVLGCLFCVARELRVWVSGRCRSLNRCFVDFTAVCFFCDAHERHPQVRCVISG